jgi:hypothetical protein
MYEIISITPRRVFNMSNNTMQKRVVTPLSQSDLDIIWADAAEFERQWKALSPAEQEGALLLDNIDFYGHMRDEQGRPIVCLSVEADRPASAEHGDGGIRVRVFYQDEFDDERWYEDQRREISGTQFATWVSRAACHKGDCSKFVKCREAMADPVGQQLLQLMRQELEQKLWMGGTDDEDVLLFWIKDRRHEAGR